MSVRIDKDKQPRLTLRDACADLAHWVSYCAAMHLFSEVPLPAIRKATRSDAKEVSQIAEEVFRATFGLANTAEDMKLHCERTYGEANQASEISDPNMCTLVSQHEGKLVGFAQLRWGPTPPCVSASSPTEIYRLYVVAAWHGSGIAQTLMNASLEEMKRRGSDVAWLGVWERNPRAISFYNKCGFVEVGAHDFLLGEDLQRDIVMVRPVPGMDSGPTDSM